MKKLLSALMSLSLLVGAAAMPAAAAETYSMGDVDMNGVVDTRDAAAILREYIDAEVFGLDAALSEAQYALGDVVNTDDNVVLNSADVIEVLRYYIYTLTASEPVTADEYFADAAAYWNAVNGDNFAQDVKTEFEENFYG